MERRLERAAVVTGAARGIGLAIANSLLRDGFLVLATDIDEISLYQADYETQERDRILRIPCDVSRERDVLLLFKEVESRFGSLDVLVNNAGIQTHEPVSYTHLTLPTKRIV